MSYPWTCYSALPLIFWIHFNLNHCCDSRLRERWACVGASPPCRHYSRLKLRNDDGPQALRTPEHLSGIPGLSPEDLAEVQESHTILARCIQVPLLVFDTGGHSHLEQPTNAMSWLEPVVRSFLKHISAYCVSVAACAHDCDWYKSWLFASSFSGLTMLGSTCQHGPDAHQAIQGTKLQDGSFLSKVTACYPTSFATAFADCVTSAISKTGLDLTLQASQSLLPIKGLLYMITPRRWKMVLALLNHLIGV